MNIKKKITFVAVGLVVLYAIVVVLLVGNFLNIDTKYVETDKANAQQIEQVLYNVFNETSEEELPDKLQEIIDMYPLELIVKKDEQTLFATMKLESNQTFRDVLHESVVAVESQGFTNGYFVWYSIYHIQDNVVFNGLLVQQNILIVVALILLSFILLIIQLYVIFPLHTLRKSINKINQYDFNNIEKGNDDINLSLNIFAQKMQNIVHAVSRNHTELELELQIERERLNNTIVVSRALVHNLKTPLHQTLLDNEYLESQQDTVSVEEITQYNIAQNDKVLNDINEILKLLRTNFYEIEHEIEQFDFVQVLMDMIALFERTFREQQIFIDLDIPDELTLKSNKMSVQLILHNILSNALKYANSESDINITMLEQDGSIIFSVQNESTPTNISRMKKTEQVFNAIEAEETSEHIYSSGNGLYLIKNISLMIGAHYNYHVDGEHVTIQITFAKGVDEGE